MTTFRRPPFVTGRAVFYWDRLLKHLSSLDGFMQIDTYSLGLLSVAFADFEEANHILASEGRYYKSGQMQRLHPACQVVKESSALIHNFSSKFGLTPKDRERLMRFKPKPKPDELDKL